MYSHDQEVTDNLADRSQRQSTLIAFGFALGGAASIITEMLPAGFSILWALWIPLCFLLIPAVHSLARQHRELRERLERLESTLDANSDNGGPS